jgi:hypothetical protein
MAIIRQLLDELTTAQDFESVRITGYLELLSFPGNLLSDLARTEVNEAYQWSHQRRSLIMQAIVCIEALMADSYPERLQQIAPLEAIEEFRNGLVAMQLAIAEFEEVAAGSLSVSEEIAVN